MKKNVTIGEHRRAATDSELGREEQPPFRLSAFWDVYLPLAFAAVPAGAFALIGYMSRDFRNPNASIPFHVAVAMGSLQILGSVALACLLLVRFDFARQQLSHRTHGRPPIWRRLLLLFAIASALLFDVVMCLTGAFGGLSALLILAVVAFCSYLLCYRVALARL